MDVYLTGQAVNLSIPFVDDAGNPLAPTAVTYRVIDETETVLVPDNALAGFQPGDDQAQITLDAATNTLADGKVRGMRIVELWLTTVSGTVKRTVEYLVEAAETLVPNVNSFQTYASALLRAFDITSLSAWNDATKAARCQAMVEARRNIGKLRFRFLYVDELTVISPEVAASDLTLVTPAQWASLPAEFKESVCRAQILEADFLLGSDVLGDIRRSGVISRTVGESSEFFGSVKPIDRPVCQRAMKELSKFLLVRNRLSRV